MTLPDKLAGQKIRCKKCGKVMTVPSGRLPALESPEVAALLLDEDQEAAYQRLYARVEAEADEAVAELRLPTEDGAPGRLTLWPSPILGWDEVHQWVLPA